jgi:hypothetical protein
VIAFNIAEGWARDVTEDIAHHVVEQSRCDDRQLGSAAQEFVDRVLPASDYAATAPA